MSRVALKGTFPIRYVIINKKLFFILFIVKLNLKTYVCLYSVRDLAVCGTIEQDPKTGRITYVTASVVDPAIPPVKKYVRAHINFTGWQIDPKFDSDGNTKAL